VSLDGLSDGASDGGAAEAAAPDAPAPAVAAIDRASGVLALKGADGSAFHIQSRQPAAVANVAPGMQVSVTFAPDVSVAVAPMQ